MNLLFNRAIVTKNGNLVKEKSVTTKDNTTNITVYRAVSKSLKGTGIANGDWSTTSLTYAKQHGEAHLDGDYKVVKKVVKAKDLFTDGNSIHEWGYDNGRDTLRSKTHYREKLVILLLHR